MGLLSNIKKVQAKGSDNDVLGGSRLFDTGLVEFTVEAAFMTESKNGATMFNIHLLDPLTKKVAKFTECIVTTAGKSTYQDKDGEDVYLPGYITINSICQLTIDTELHSFGEDDTDMKTIALWRDGGEKPTEVEMVTEMVGKQITIGVIRRIVDKTEKNPGFDSSKRKHKTDNPEYIPTGETREENAIGKVFHTETGATVQELEAGFQEGDTPEFRTKWAAKNTETVDLSKGRPDGAPKSGSPSSSSVSSDAAPKKKLFGNKTAG